MDLKIGGSICVRKTQRMRRCTSCLRLAVGDEIGGDVSESVAGAVAGAVCRCGRRGVGIRVYRVVLSVRTRPQGL